MHTKLGQNWASTFRRYVENMIFYMFTFPLCPPPPPPPPPPNLYNYQCPYHKVQCEFPYIWLCELNPSDLYNFNSAYSEVSKYRTSFKSSSHCSFGEDFWRFTQFNPFLPTMWKLNDDGRSELIRYPGLNASTP